jgi:hypothetical protein
MAFRNFRYSSDGHDVSGPITLVEGNTLKLKLDGVKAAGKALRYEVSSDGAPCPLQVTTNAKSNQLEQIVTIHVTQCVSQSHYTVRAVLPKGAKTNGAALPVTPLQIEIVPKIVLPPLETDAGLIARLLLAEAQSPLKDGYGNGAAVREAMDLMRQVLDSRVYASSTKLGHLINLVPKGASLREIIFAPRQVEGFKGGNISGNAKKNIDDFKKIMNDGADGDFKKVRAHVEYAIKVAKRQPSLPSRITENTLTHWRTQGSGKPTNNAVLFRKIAGQEFWTLSAKFLKENPQ